MSLDARLQRIILQLFKYSFPFAQADPIASQSRSSANSGDSISTAQDKDIREDRSDALLCDPQSSV